MPVRPLYFLTLALVGILPSAAGCHSAKPAAVSAAKSAGPVKLTAQEVATRIRGVESSNSIPASLKPGIIQSIRAQGQ